MILTLARFELMSLLRAHTGWLIYAGASITLGFLFLGYVDQHLSQAQGRVSVMDHIVVQTFGDTAVLCLFLTPLVTMRMLSHESPYTPLSLLLASPLSAGQIVAGKFAGALLFLLPLILLPAMMYLSLGFGTPVNLPRLAAALVGLAGVCMTLVALGLLLSLLLKHSVAAAMASYAVFLLLWILDWALPSEAAGGGILSFLAIIPHYEAALRGLLTSTDVVYFAALTGGALGVCRWRLRQWIQPSGPAS